MSDHQPPPHARPAPARAASRQNNTAGVRRNLFQSQLTRRPTPTGFASAPPSSSHSVASSTHSAASSSAETLRLDQNKTGSGGSSSNNNNNNNRSNGYHHGPNASSSSSSAVAPDLLLSDDAGVGGGGYGSDDDGNHNNIIIRDKNGDFELCDPPTPPPEDLEEGALDDAQETERERQKLAEAVRQHQISRNRPRELPEEVMDLLKTSMRAQVAALADDNWMFEAEEPPRAL